MSQTRITRYKTENGKTRRDKSAPGRAAGKNGTPEANPGVNNKNQPANPAK